ncbi:hypothetical protein DM790_16290 [Flavobacterium collinsii]|nr:hypothetical protein [Flavobacterium collinsii]
MKFILIKTDYESAFINVEDISMVIPIGDTKGTHIKLKGSHDYNTLLDFNTVVDLIKEAKEI